jgi:hypothetical protein
VLQLVQAGKINLSDPLGKYLPDYPNKDLASKVTIHHLLSSISTDLSCARSRTMSGSTGNEVSPSIPLLVRGLNRRQPDTAILWVFLEYLHIMA